MGLLTDIGAGYLFGLGNQDDDGMLPPQSETMSGDDDNLVEMLVTSVETRIFGGPASESDDNSNPEIGRSDLAAWEKLVDKKYAEEAEKVYKRLINDSDQLNRILRTCRQNMKQSTDMFIEQVKFHAEYRPSEIQPETIANSLPSGAWRLSGYSKEGCVVSTFSLSQWDPHQYSEDIEEAVEEFIRYTTYMIELIIASMSSTGPQQSIAIFDLTGFSVGMTFDEKMQRMICEMIWLAQEQYPERLKKCLIVNAPLAFNAGWTLISPLLDERTAVKVSFVNIDQLAEYIDTEVLTVEYGGTHEEYPIPSKNIAEERTTLQCTVASAEE